MYINIIVYQGKSFYGALRCFADEMAASFTKLGHNVTVIDVFKENWTDKVKQAILDYNGCDFFFSFSAFGIDTVIDNRSLYDFINAPFVARW